MNKNIEVVDEAGNVYEPTWPKRAKGLVKNGRARFVEENRICLACPAEEITEDKIMSDIKIDQTTGEVIENVKTDTVPEIPVNSEIESEEQQGEVSETEHDFHERMEYEDFFTALVEIKGGIILDVQKVWLCCKM